MLELSYRIVDGKPQECATDAGQILVYVKPDENEQQN
jgi:hypothetical protein